MTTAIVAASVWVANERCSANQTKMARRTMHRRLKQVSLITVRLRAKSGVVLELRTAAAVVSQLNRHRCDHRTPGENTRRAGRDQVAEQNPDRLHQSHGCLVKGHA